MIHPQFGQSSIATSSPTAGYARHVNDLGGCYGSRDNGRARMCAERRTGRSILFNILRTASSRRSDSCDPLIEAMNSHRLLLVQISRYDRFKDPVGGVASYRMVRRVAPVQLVLAGGGATDDPEGEAVLEDVMEAAGNDPDIHVLLLPHDSHKTVNALQRVATIILHKSTREGFGLTVTEGMCKGKPVIGGDPPPSGEPPLFASQWFAGRALVDFPASASSPM